MRDMINSLYLPELREMLAQHDGQGLREFCAALHPGRTADFMDGLTADESWQVLQYAEMPVRVETFGFMDREKQVEILESNDLRQLGEFIGHMPPDDRVDVLNLVDAAVVDQLLPHIPPEERRDILRLRAHPEGTAGAVMTSEIAKLPEQLNARQALEAIAQQAEDLETIYYIYIVDDEDHLRGVVSARTLLSNVNKPDVPLSELMERDVVTVNVTDDQEQMADKVARYDLLAIPVVDSEHRLLGIITHDDVIDVMREEATEDAHRLGAVEPLKESYFETHWGTLTRARAKWLVLLFFAALLTAWALEAHRTELEKTAWLVVFIPLVMSAGGNSGSQTAILIITAMTLGEIRLRDWLRVVLRELGIGLSLGAFLAVIGYLAALLMTRGDPYASLVMPLTVLLVVVCGTFLGAVLPLLFSRLGQDPALMSTPLLAGIIDIVGILIYLAVAQTILNL